jgi:hypothetical protein
MRKNNGTVFWDCECLLLCEFPHQKQQKVLNTAKLSENCVKPLKERDQYN